MDDALGSAVVQRHFRGLTYTLKLFCWSALVRTSIGTRMPRSTASARDPDPCGTPPRRRPQKLADHLQPTSGPRLQPREACAQTLFPSASVRPVNTDPEPSPDFLCGDLTNPVGVRSWTEAGRFAWSQHDRSFGMCRSRFAAEQLFGSGPASATGARVALLCSRRRTKRAAYDESESCA